MNYKEIKPGLMIVLCEMQVAISENNKANVIELLKTYKQIVTNTYYNNEMCGEHELMQLERKTIRSLALFLTEEFPA